MFLTKFVIANMILLWEFHLFELFQARGFEKQIYFCVQVDGLLHM
jgi:hypothetical protein